MRPPNALVFQHQNLKKTANVIIYIRKADERVKEIYDQYSISLSEGYLV